MLFRCARKWEACRLTQVLQGLHRTRLCTFGLVRCLHRILGGFVAGTGPSVILFGAPAALEIHGASVPLRQAVRASCWVSEGPTPRSKQQWASSANQITLPMATPSAAPRGHAPANLDVFAASCVAAPTTQIKHLRECKTAWVAERFWDASPSPPDPVGAWFAHACASEAFAQTAAAPSSMATTQFCKHLERHPHNVSPQSCHETSRSPLRPACGSTATSAASCRLSPRPHLPRLGFKRGPQPRLRNNRNIARCFGPQAPLQQDLGTGASPGPVLRKGFGWGARLEPLEQRPRCWQRKQRHQAGFCSSSQ